MRASIIKGVFTPEELGNVRELVRQLDTELNLVERRSEGQQLSLAREFFDSRAITSASGSNGLFYDLTEGEDLNWVKLERKYQLRGLYQTVEDIVPPCPRCKQRHCRHCVPSLRAMKVDPGATPEKTSDRWARVVRRLANKKFFASGEKSIAPRGGAEDHDTRALLDPDRDLSQVRDAVMEWLDAHKVVEEGSRIKSQLRLVDRYLEMRADADTRRQVLQKSVPFGHGTSIVRHCFETAAPSIAMQIPDDKGNNGVLPRDAKTVLKKLLAMSDAVQIFSDSFVVLELCWFILSCSHPGEHDQHLQRTKPHPQESRPQNRSTKINPAS